MKREEIIKSLLEDNLSSNANKITNRKPIPSPIRPARPFQSTVVQPERKQNIIGQKIKDFFYGTIVIIIFILLHQFTNPSGARYEGSHIRAHR
jgi:hypothetical protein